MTVAELKRILDQYPTDAKAKVTDVYEFDRVQYVEVKRVEAEMIRDFIAQNAQDLWMIAAALSGVRCDDVN